MATCSKTEMPIWHMPARAKNVRVHSVFTRSGQGKNLSNQEETYSGSSKTEEKPPETRENWVVQIKQTMEQVRKEWAKSHWDKLCIYKVPPYLKENDSKSYFPQIVSLGPYHRGEKHLVPMDFHKWRAVNTIIDRTKQDIGVYFDAMKMLEEKARACYHGPIIMSSDEFTEMLVRDGCFVLELFLGSLEGFVLYGYDRNDPVSGKPTLIHVIRRDMIMLENQLPLFILDRLLQLQLGRRMQDNLVARLALRFFAELMPTGEALFIRETSKLENLPKLSYLDVGKLHCLDVFHQNIFKDDLVCKPQISSRKQQLVHCVTELREAGVEFKKKKGNNFWDIEFKNGRLKMPKLVIQDGTKSLFLNLIAYEQCHMDSGNNITSYIHFMDHLINSSDDVSYLHKCGIIEYWLGSASEVADLFNQLCKEVVFDPNKSYLSQLSYELNCYYNRRWNYSKALLRHKYFGNPWAYFSFLAAVILLFLTLSQTFYAVYSYHKPSL